MVKDPTGKIPTISFQVGVYYGVSSVAASQELLVFVTESVITDLKLHEVSGNRSYFTGETSVETMMRLFGGEYQLSLDGHWQIIKEPSVPDRLRSWLEYVEVGPRFEVCSAFVEGPFGD